MAKTSVAPNVAAAKWSDGDALVLMKAAIEVPFQTQRFKHAFTKWHRAMSIGRDQDAARNELRAAAITVCKRARGKEAE